MDIDNKLKGLSFSDSVMKRTFDLIFSCIGLIATGWIIIIAYFIAMIDTGSGFFSQIRVGKNGRLFKVLKIRTMISNKNVTTTVTTANDTRITTIGRFFRRTKIDELPQFINVFLGQMSFVGPRPDVPGFADQLKGEDRIVLSIRPGITGPATIKYKYEEKILSEQPAPELYNREVIFPDKVRINKQYILDYSFFTDLKLIIKTIAG